MESRLWSITDTRVKCALGCAPAKHPKNWWWFNVFKKKSAGEYRKSATDNHCDVFVEVQTFSPSPTLFYRLLAIFGSDSGLVIQLATLFCQKSAPLICGQNFAIPHPVRVLKLHGIFLSMTKGNSRTEMQQTSRWDCYLNVTLLTRGEVGYGFEFHLLFYNFN